MFTTLPLELFVCREVRWRRLHPLHGLIYHQVIEQFFFSHETFSMNRHVFFTSVILMSSMTRE